ncbi:hypothetical protein DVH24_037624 [Malus domestica]|uniref:Uncharacterized protein n=1 Tax=Malus domestica TaxID=3750 RepID=A0A498IX32_MALDO|nr:hypothetical protein DVH24_037624 [Malus domestica]
MSSSKRLLEINEQEKELFEEDEELFNFEDGEDEVFEMEEEEDDELRSERAPHSRRVIKDVGEISRLLANQATNCVQN